MKKITPYLLFNGQAEEAARFYVTLLPGSHIDKVTYWPSETPGEADDADAENEVLTVEFTFGGTEFVALNGPQFPFTEAVSFSIACEDQAETDRLWAALTADGGSEGPCGWLKDRWGMSWQVTPTRLLELTMSPDPARARRALEAMMKMTKIDIAQVERAADGA